MRTRIFSTPGSAARALAAAVGAAVEANPSLVLALPTGRTPVPFYAALAAVRTDFSRVSTFNLDEFVGVAGSDPRSYRAFMQRHLFDHVNIAPRRIHFLNGLAVDTDAECSRYERAIVRAGGIDLMILGLGRNGHIGFNEPGSSVTAATHRARLAPATRRANLALFGGAAAAVPRSGLTMGIATMLRARRIVLVATGAGKSHVVARMVNGPVTPQLPASFLQLHPATEIWLDRAAAARLSA